MMSLNRYRLKYLVKENDKGAIRADKLLKRPDRLLGVILIGNNFVNILAASLTTVLCLNLFGDSGVVIGSVVLTLIILIFAEITPKTFAALNSEKVALLVGPEGGFSDSERNLLRTKKNVLPVSLGNRILRAETAAVVALTMWHGLVGDWHKRVDHQNYES